MVLNSNYLYYEKNYPFKSSGTRVAINFFHICSSKVLNSLF